MRLFRDDNGMATAGVLLALALATVALVALVNVIVYQYGRGAVRSAIDQAARTGSQASASEAACEQRARETLDVILGGPLGNDLTVTCQDDGRHVRATATGTFHGWLEIVPDWTWSITATATKEHAP
jgi:hypothetical protein